MSSEIYWNPEVISDAAGRPLFLGDHTILPCTELSRASFERATTGQHEADAEPRRALWGEAYLLGRHDEYRLGNTQAPVLDASRIPPGNAVRLSLRTAPAEHEAENGGRPDRYEQEVRHWAAEVSLAALRTVPLTEAAAGERVRIADILARFVLEGASPPASAVALAHSS